MHLDADLSAREPIRHDSRPPQRPLRRVAMISVHTSPLEQPGTGDAGGLNVYVVETARGLVRRGIEVEIFTRATTGALDEVVELEPGITVRHVLAGPFEGLRKEDLPGQLCAFAAGMMRAGVAHPEGHYDVVHSHYWLSGQVGWLSAERWQVPLIHTMHTMARVKNAALAEGDTPEPMGREIGEAQVVEAAHRLVANTDDEAQAMIALYHADPARVVVVNPGVDLELFAPGDRLAARDEVGLPRDAVVVQFVGRIQPLKAPDVLIRAAAQMVDADPGLRSRLIVPILGGPSGTGLARPTALAELVEELGLEGVVRFVPPTSRRELAAWYRAADVVAVPSYNESFGLVAVEAQASGTPVVAAAVGGLPVVVGEAGVLVPGHDPQDWARALAGVLAEQADPARRARLSEAARTAAQAFSWDRTVDELVEVYAEARRAYAEERRAVIGESRPLHGVPEAVVP